MRVGLTGGIASGKNFVAKLFSDYGFHTIDLDDISRIVMQKDTQTYFDILAHFGSEILSADKQIDRKKLASIIFNDKNEKQILESIVHKAILDYESRLVSQILSKDSKADILSHAALMIESGRYKRYDRVILVYADTDDQIKRAMMRDNSTEETVNKIIQNQMSFEEKLPFADIIIDNSKNIEHTKNEVKRVVELLKLIEYGSKHIEHKN